VDKFPEPLNYSRVILMLEGLNHINSCLSLFVGGWRVMERHSSTMAGFDRQG